MEIVGIRDTVDMARLVASSGRVALKITAHPPSTEKTALLVERVLRTMAVMTNVKREVESGRIRGDEYPDSALQELIEEYFEQCATLCNPLHDADIEENNSGLAKLRLGKLRKTYYAAIQYTRVEQITAKLAMCIDKILRSAPTTTAIAMLARGVLVEWETEASHWSGTGQRFDVDYKTLRPDFAAQLKKERLLGTGRYGQVHKVTFRSIPMVRKSVKLQPHISKDLLETLKAESSVGHKLEGHIHIIKTVGTYWKGSSHLNILTFPVAVCDLGRYLDGFRIWRNANSETLASESEGFCDRFQELGAGYLSNKGAPEMRLKEIMGCITQGMIWMHRKGIAHRDLKPPNILLRRNEVYLSDFGISRDRSKTERNTTDLYIGSTRGYTAPEVTSDWYNAQEADVYSLGCVFLHILTEVYWPQNLLRTAPRGANPDCHREEHFLDILSSNSEHPYIPRQLVAVMQPMFCGAEKRNLRPSMEGVDESLRTIHPRHGIFHGSCCRSASDVRQTAVAILDSWEEEGTQWSATGQAFDLDVATLDEDLRLQLGPRSAVFEHADTVNFYSRSAGIQASIHYRGVGLRRESMPLPIFKPFRNYVLENVSLFKEQGIHRHIPRLVGTFVDGRAPYRNSDTAYASILTFPSTTCDLAHFLDHSDLLKFQLCPGCLSFEICREAVDHFDAIGIHFAKESHLQVAARLGGIMGCVTQALIWIHNKGLQYAYLDPTNILLEGEDVFITNVAQSHVVFSTDDCTEYEPYRYARYSAPECGGDETFCTRRAGIYSLGCLFLRILTSIYKPSGSIPRWWSHDQDSVLRQQSAILNDCLSVFEERPHPYIPPEFVDLLEWMMDDDPNERPNAEAVDRALRKLGGPEQKFHGPCCRTAQHEEDTSDSESASISEPLFSASAPVHSASLVNSFECVSEEVMAALQIETVHQINQTATSQTDLEAPRENQAAMYGTDLRSTDTLETSGTEASVNSQQPQDEVHIQHEPPATNNSAFITNGNVLVAKEDMDGFPELNSGDPVNSDSVSVPT